jgi:hypothetical protein
MGTFMISKRSLTALAVIGAAENIAAQTPGADG